MQPVAIALCLGHGADIYLIDEPSADLDSEQRIMASKVAYSVISRCCVCFLCKSKLIKSNVRGRNAIETFKEFVYDRL